MTVLQFKKGNTQTFVGLSTDAKPVSTGLGGAQTGDYFFEADTGKTSVYSVSSGWAVLSQVVNGAVLTTTVQPPANVLSVPMSFSSGGTSVAQNTVLLSIPDITPYTYFGIQNTSGFALFFQISLDGVTFQTVGMNALATPGTWVTTLATATTYTRGSLKGVAAQVLAGNATSSIYTTSWIQLSAGNGGP